MWLYRRSEEPSPTDCYWKKSVLSEATTTKKCVGALGLETKHFYLLMRDTIQFTTNILTRQKTERYKTVLHDITTTML